MACPICTNETDPRYRPFCSRRCADIDLGRWLTGSYVIPGQAGPGNDDSNPAEGWEEDETRPPPSTRPRRH